MGVDRHEVIERFVMRNEYLAKIAAGILDKTKYWAWGYSDVIVHGDGLKTCDGALLIPNHIEAGDTVAIGTAVYKETGMPPYFVMKSSLPFSPVLEATRAGYRGRAAVNCAKLYGVTRRVNKRSCLRTVHNVKMCARTWRTW